MTGYNRREFLRGAAGLALAAAGGCRSFGGSGLAVNGVRVGVQMWSIDDLWRKNPVQAFRRLKAMGYDGVQSMGFYELNRRELANMLDGEGLEIVDMPFDLPMVAPDRINAFVEFCQQFGIDFAIDPQQKFKKADEWRRYAETMVGLQARLAKFGIRTGYHNHQPDIRDRYDGKSPMDYLIEAGLDFELDVGHVKLAGEDPVALLKRLRGRVPSIHAKPAGGNSVGGKDDVNDWPAIFRAAAAAGTRWAIVECETRRNTYEDVEKSIIYMKGIEA